MKTAGVSAFQHLDILFSHLHVHCRFPVLASSRPRSTILFAPYSRGLPKQALGTNANASNDAMSQTLKYTCVQLYVDLSAKIPAEKLPI